MPLNAPARPPLVTRPFPVRGAAARFASPPFVSAGRGVELPPPPPPPPPPITAYGNTGGTGNRTGIISITRSFTSGLIPADCSNLVDGGYGDNIGDSLSLFGTLNFSDGDYWELDFGSQQYLDEATLRAGGALSWGDWRWRSFHGGGFVDLNVFTWSGAATLIVPIVGMASQGTQVLRLQKVGATAGATNGYLREFEFKLAPGAV